jgi:gamma-glutamylcyclotransferase (GGCT)/AIG2-like uncharacterized protein YtfP
VAASDHRLAVYGSLAPGRENHAQIAGLNGQWLRGTVRGHLTRSGWGATLGYLGITLDPDAPPVEVQVFESPDLPAHWSRLDAFEGDGYRRVPASVKTAGGTLAAWIYEIVPASAAEGE